MRAQSWFGIVVFTVLAGSGMGVANALELTADQQRAINQGLSGQQVDHSQAAAQAQVGGRLADTVPTNPMPDRVAANVPSVKNLLFVRLPDRVLLINPDDHTIAEIVVDTGGAASRPVEGSTGMGAHDDGRNDSNGNKDNTGNK